MNPSSENLAATIYNMLKEIKLAAKLYSVEVWESPDAGVEYRPDVMLLRSDDPVIREPGGHHLQYAERDKTRGQAVLRRGLGVARRRRGVPPGRHAAPI